MIQVEHLTKTYGKGQNVFAALDDVSFTIPDGKTAAIVGKSGSGKSTLLQLLGGLDRPTSGTISVNGEEITRLKGKALDRFRAQKLGFVFQAFFVEATQSCYQNVALPLEISNLSRSQRREKILAALEKVDLAEKINVQASKLSGGQKQRLAIARAIVTGPSLILADEPTGNLDSATGDRVVDLLFDLHREQGSTLVIVTHDTDLAARCDVQINIKDGKIASISGQKAAPKRKRVVRV